MLIALGRILNAVFFLVTAIYCTLTYSPFAYEQFIQPNMLAWLSNFVFLHADFYWLALCVTLLTMAPRLARAHKAASPLRAVVSRRVGWAYLALSAAVGVVMLLVPVLPAGNMPIRSLAVAMAALVPIVWLAVWDHLTAVRRPSSGDREASHILAQTLIAALFVWATFAAFAPMRLRAAGGVAASAAVLPLLAGIAVSLVWHLTAFTIAFLLIASARALRVPVRVIAVVALAVILQRVVLVPISVAGGASWTLAAGLSIAFVALASGVARQVTPPTGRPLTTAIAVVALPACAFMALQGLTTFDWGFMLQKLTALTVAVLAWHTIGAATRWKVAPTRAALAILALYIVSVFAVPRLPSWFKDPRLNPEFALDAYSAADPSFRLVRQFLDTNQAIGGDAAFYAYLRANSSLKDPIDPVEVQFANLTAPSDSKPPHIFFFIIDSLRRDYVSAYNPSVTFTPRLAEFARDSDVFTRAFTRYGGTGLAVPSIWAGALVAHKQYVTPFAPMNALAKLLDAGGYRRIVTRDHITDELFGLGNGTDVLDVGVLEMMHTFCGTLEELNADLKRTAGDPRPIFAHTRPLDLHIGNTRFAAVPPGESYPGFFAPYAARVNRIDSCFGGFVDELKRARLYDNSLIIVMADHGDSLGEGLRWGHGYTIAPEVLRIPLLIHVPLSLRHRFTTDVSQLAFSTDVTPSLYQLLGRGPTHARDELGVSLYYSAGTPIESRRRESFLVASSYGAVYGLLAANGRQLYIADAIEGRDSMYDLSPAGGDARIGMTDRERTANREEMRAQVAHLAAWYRYGQPEHP